MANLQYNTQQFQEITERILNIAKNKADVSHACVQISEDQALDVSVRQNQIENVEHAHTQQVNISIYIKHKVGHASGSAFDDASLNNMIDAAYHIAKYTNEDVYAGLAEQDDLALGNDLFDCDLNHPWHLNTAQAITLAKDMENIVYTYPHIHKSEGCGVGTHSGHFMLANTLGFCGGYPYSNHNLWANAIASKDGKMQSDSWSSNKRCPLLLETPQAVAHKAAKRAQDKLDARKLSTRKCPVIFEASIAAGILYPIFSALGGRAQYQKNSFLLDAVGTQILPRFLSLYENPFVKKGLSSGPFDDDGVKVNARFNVENGIIQHYFLSAYSARKLGLKNTGHAGGTHNIYLQSNAQHIDATNKIFTDLDALLKHMHTGLLITDVMGQGVNITTGDYSKGASGFWVENGIIMHAVEEITIAGNIKDMLLNIQGVALDTYEGRMHTGSILLENMTVAGI